MSSALFDEKTLNSNSSDVVNDDDEARFKIVSEIVSSEKKYVEQLNVLNSLYIVPIEASQDLDPILTIDQSSIIFNNLTVIKQLNGIFFYKMKERLVNWNKTALIGDIFIDFVPYFKMYMSYVNNQETATTMLREQQKSNVKFINFCKQCDQSPLAQNQNLYSFLIMPIQRIPRYCLLIRDLIKKTSDSHPDYDNLSKAHSMLEDVTKKIDQAIGDHKNRDVIYSIQESFLDDVVFLEPKRKYIYNGVLTKICRNSKKKYTFFLFSDMLVYASKSGKKFKLHRKLKINEAFKFENLADNEKAINRMLISTSEKSFEVIADDYSDKQEWLNHFNSVVSEATKKSTDKRKKSLTVAPVWQPDVSSKSCKICKSKFSVFKRRHHCRKCGLLVCNECSRGRILLKEVDENQEVRVCDNCDKGEKTNLVGQLNFASSGTESKKVINGKFQDGKKVYCSQYVALYDYEGIEGDLPLVKGQTVMVVFKDKSGWWTGIIGKKVGMFPSNYISELSEQKPVPPKNPKPPLPPRPTQRLPMLPSLGNNKTLSPARARYQKTPIYSGHKPPPPPPKALSLRSNSSSVIGCVGITDGEDFDPQCHPVNIRHNKAQSSYVEVQVIALEDYTSNARDELAFHQNDRLSIKYRNEARGWCYGLNKETQKSGWISESYIAERDALKRLDRSTQLACSCAGFAPNAFRPSLCKECFHNINSHVIGKKK